MKLKTKTLILCIPVVSNCLAFIINCLTIEDEINILEKYLKLVVKKIFKTLCNGNVFEINCFFKRQINCWS